MAGKRLNLRELQRVSLFLYMGGKDDNDSVVFRDGYEEAAEKLVFELFGKTPVSRWEVSSELYRDRKLDAVFKLYRDAGHSVSEEMKKDIIELSSLVSASPRLANRVIKGRFLE